MSALERIGTIVLFSLLAMTAVHWLTNPVRRDGIERRATNHRININTADVATLSLLSGVSATIGQYIVEHRQTHGPLRSLEDLDAIRFVGPVTIRKIAPYVSFDVP